MKLRNGGMVDQDDFGRGWLLTRLLGKSGPSQLRDDEDDDLENGGEESERALGGGTFDGASENGNGNGRAGRKPTTKWGARAISVSADDGVLEGRHGGGGVGPQESGVVAGERNGVMKDPDEMARVLDEDEDDDVDGLLPAPVDGNGAEWREGRA